MRCEAITEVHHTQIRCSKEQGHDGNHWHASGLPDGINDVVWNSVTLKPPSKEVSQP